MRSPQSAIEAIPNSPVLTGGNPVFRVYDVDPDTYEIMDFTPYFSASGPSALFFFAELALTRKAANRSEPSFDIEPVWQPYYSARESYGALVPTPLAPEASLDGPFWHRVTEVMQRDECAFPFFSAHLPLTSNSPGVSSSCTTRASRGAAK